MVLFVEGTSRWCWTHPFMHKSAAHIAAIITKFIEFIDERITCLVTIYIGYVGFLHTAHVQPAKNHWI